jgi:hypothetical protein
MLNLLYQPKSSASDPQRLEDHQSHALPVIHAAVMASGLVAKIGNLAVAGAGIPSACKDRLEVMQILVVYKAPSNNPE